MIIAVDFDGTICHNAYPGIGTIQPYAREALQQLTKQGHYIIIWTCRCGERLLEAINWLVMNDIPFHRVNDHNPDNIALYGEGGKKIYADIYIDDKNIGGFPGWQEVIKILEIKKDGER